MWHRIHRVAKSRGPLLQREMLGYLTGGSQMLIDRLSEEIRRMGGEIQTGVEVSSLITENDAVAGLRCGDGFRDFDRIVSTVALPAVCRMLPTEWSAYRSALERVNYIGVVCMILKLSRPLSDSFWININDSRISFNGIIEYTNLNPREEDLSGTKIAYIPYYLMTCNERYSYGDRQLFDEYCSSLTLVNPDFTPEWVREWRVFRDPYAQAICTTGFSRLVPAQRSPLAGFYVIDSTQLYPSDRTISGMIGLARKLAEGLGEETP
jgi:protoporphyrinogen oxidase